MSKKVLSKVRVPSELFSGLPDQMTMEILAHPTKVPGLVVLDHRPYIDRHGNLKQKEGQEVRLTDGRLVACADAYLMLTTREVIKRANAMAGPDWTNVPADFLSPEARTFTDAARRGWLGEE